MLYFFVFVYYFVIITCSILPIFSHFKLSVILVFSTSIFKSQTQGKNLYFLNESVVSS